MLMNTTTSRLGQALPVFTETETQLRMRLDELSLNEIRTFQNTLRAEAAQFPEPSRIAALEIMQREIFNELRCRARQIRKVGAVVIAGAVIAGVLFWLGKK
jgi:hypothetical protein